MPPTVAQPMPDRCMHCSLRGAALCRLIASTDVPGVRPASLRRFSRNDMISQAGTNQRMVGVLRRGYLRKQRLNRIGRRTVFDLALPGDVVGELPGRNLAYSLEAATDAEICVFDDTTVQHMMAGDGAFCLRLLQAMADQLASLHETIWQRGALTCRERILAFLVMSARVMPIEPRPDGSIIVTIELARRDWAGLSNTTVESISRVMSQLSAKGLVKTIAPGRYWIRDLGQLARLAGMDLGSDCGRMRQLDMARSLGGQEIAA